MDTIEKMWASLKAKLRRKKMDENFETALKRTLEIEGGYVNHPDDPGGETYRGCARKLFPNWKGWTIIDKYKEGYPDISTKKLEALLHSDAQLQIEVRDFYLTEFWKPLQAGKIDSKIVAMEYFDTGVNCGHGTTKRFLQEVLNFLNLKEKRWEDLEVDGKVGPKTLAACNKATKNKQIESALFVYLNCLQGARYVGLGKKNEKFESFAIGWALRARTDIGA